MAEELQPPKPKLCIKDIKGYKSALNFLWQNRRSVSGYTIGSLVLYKWWVGDLTTEELGHLLKVLNPLSGLF